MERWELDEAARQRVRNEARERLGHPPLFDESAFDDPITLSSDGAHAPADAASKAADEDAVLAAIDTIRQRDGCDDATAFQTAQREHAALFLRAASHSTTPENLQRIGVNMLRHGGLSLADARERVHGAAGSTRYELSAAEAEVMVAAAIGTYQATHPDVSYETALQHVAEDDPDLVKLAIGIGTPV